MKPLVLKHIFTDSMIADLLKKNVAEVKQAWSVQ